MQSNSGPFFVPNLGRGFIRRCDIVVVVLTVVVKNELVEVYKSNGEINVAIREFLFLSKVIRVQYSD